MPDDIEAPHRLVDGIAVPLTADEIAARQAEEAAREAAPPRDRLIAKTLIYRRATDDELASLEQFLAGSATLRQRLMWADAENGHVHVSEVQPLAIALFGEDRAAELLAR